MAEGLVEAPFSTYPNEVRNLFAAMEANVGSSWPDPAGLGPRVSDQMTTELVTAARKALQEAQRKAALAMRAEETGRQGEALRIWREVLGDYSRSSRGQEPIVGLPAVLSSETVSAVQR